MPGDSTISGAEYFFHISAYVVIRIFRKNIFYIGLGDTVCCSALYVIGGWRGYQFHNVGITVENSKHIRQIV